MHKLIIYGNIIQANLGNNWNEIWYIQITQIAVILLVFNSEIIKNMKGEYCN